MTGRARGWLAIVAAICAAMVLGQGAQAQDPAVPEPDGYRMTQFRAPVPATLAGGTVLDTAAARQLWEDGDAIFVDVLPQPPRPETLPEGTIWQAPRRDTIENAVWLPNVGFGEISPEMDAYFRSHLTDLTGGETAHPVVIFCQADCWMSWNAARRAIVEYGMSRVYWYPLGTNGWEEAGLPLVKVAAEE